MPTRANRNFGDDGEIRGIANFNPGGNDFSVIRQVDGRTPQEGSNIHQPSAGDPMWGDPLGNTVECD